MTLSFSEYWADGSPTHFKEKIWLSKLGKNPSKEKIYYLFQQQNNFAIDYTKNFNKNFSIDIFAPKLHTLREDKKNRWKAGNKIHPVIHNRTPNRFQFAPTMECKSVQQVTISTFFVFGMYGRELFIDNKLFYTLMPSSSKLSSLFIQKANDERMLQFARNDGFEDIDSFFEFFFPNGEEGEKNLKLIHWTDLKY